MPYDGMAAYRAVAGYHCMHYPQTNLGIGAAHAGAFLTFILASQDPGQCWKRILSTYIDWRLFLAHMLDRQFYVLVLPWPEMCA